MYRDASRDREGAVSVTRMFPRNPQNGDCYQFPPLELDSRPRFARDSAIPPRAACLFGRLVVEDDRGP